jgi:uncharacterized protein YjiK
LVALLAASLVLFGCGGGGGGGSSGGSFNGQLPHNPPGDPGGGDPGGGDPGGGDPGGGGGSDPGGDPGNDPPGDPGGDPGLPGHDIYAGFENVHALAWDEDTGTVYGVDASSGMLYSVGPGDDEVQPRGLTELVGVRGLVFLPSTGRLYASANLGAGSHLFEIEPAAGQSTSLGPIVGFSSVESLERELAGGMLYGVDADSNQLLRIDPGTGLPFVIGSLGADVGRVEGLALDTAGHRLFGLDAANDELIQIDTNTGAAVVVAPTTRPGVAGIAYASSAMLFFGSDTAAAELFSFEPFGLAISLAPVLALAHDPEAGVLYGSHVGRGMLLKMDPEGGWKQPVGPIGHGMVEALAYDPALQRLYGVSNATDLLIVIDLQTGAGNAIGPLNVSPGGPWMDVAGLAWDAEAGVLYGVDGASASLIQIDPNTGIATFALSLPSSNVRSLAYEPQSRVLHAYDNLTGTRFVIDPALGRVTPSAGPVPAIGGMAFDPESGRLFGTDITAAQLIVVMQRLPGLGFDQIASLAYDEVNQRLFAVDKPTNQLLTIDPTTRRVVNAVPLLTGLQIDALAYDPALNTLYAADAAAGSVWALNPVGGGGVPVGPLGFVSVKGLAFDADARVLYAVDSATDVLLVVDLASGSAEPVTGQVFGFDAVESLTYDVSTQTLLGVDRVTRALLEIDPVEGAAVPVGIVESPGIGGIAWDPLTNQLFAVDTDSNELVNLDRNSGQTLP